nr:MAG TPA: hypothetical protein [Caudoviricetes sp.]
MKSQNISSKKYFIKLLLLPRYGAFYLPNLLLTLS